MRKNKRGITKDSVPRESLDHALKEVRMDEEFVRDIILREGYSPIGRKVIDIGPISDIDFLKSRFSCHYDLIKFNDVARAKQHFVTGFGPTNAPTGGTLSMILRAIFLEKKTGIDSTIIISNLGAFNSRNISLDKVEYLTGRFIKFIRSLGFGGNLRTHDDFNLLVASGLTSKMLTIDDFLAGEEATTRLYKKLGLQGKDFPTFFDANLTIADILLPCIVERKERIMVFVGIEEHYFPKLANIVIERFNKNYPGKFISKNSAVTAVFGHVIQGLNGFPKMSKSIPSSSINLDDSIPALRKKILNCREDDEKIILQMISLVSDWDSKKIAEANVSFQKKGSEWMDAKKEYLGYFIRLKLAWEKTENDKHGFKVGSLFK